MHTVEINRNAMTSILIPESHVYCLGISDVSFLMKDTCVNRLSEY